MAGLSLNFVVKIALQKGVNFIGFKIPLKLVGLSLTVESKIWRTELINLVKTKS